MIQKAIGDLPGGIPALATVYVDTETTPRAIVPGVYVPGVGQWYPAVEVHPENITAAKWRSADPSVRAVAAAFEADPRCTVKVRYTLEWPVDGASGWTDVLDRPMFRPLTHDDPGAYAGCHSRIEYVRE